MNMDLTFHRCWIAIFKIYVAYTKHVFDASDLRHQFDSYRNSLVILISKTSEIVDMLFQKDKMTSLHAGMIKSTRNPFKRNEMLLDVLRRSKDDTREATLEIFKQTQQNEVLFLFKSSGMSNSSRF